MGTDIQYLPRNQKLAYCKKQIQFSPKKIQFNKYSGNGTLENAVIFAQKHSTNKTKTFENATVIKIPIK